MYILVTYDVNTIEEGGSKRLRLVAKCCKQYGQRVQNSVFECLISDAKLVEFRAKLLSIIDKENDSIRIYKLGKNYKNSIEHIGVETSFDFEGELIV